MPQYDKLVRDRILFLAIASLWTAGGVITEARYWTFWSCRMPLPKKRPACVSSPSALR